MSQKGRGPGQHTGRTFGGSTRQVIVERIGSVTIYQRGRNYHLAFQATSTSWSTPKMRN